MRVRAATIADASAISALVTRTIRISNSRDYAAHHIERVASSFSLMQTLSHIQQRLVLVAVDGDLLTGTAALRDDWLKSLFVLPERQGEGIGRLLLSVIEQEACRRGLPRLQLHASLTAERFYRGLGYQLLGKRNSEGEVTLHMEKRLASISSSH